MQRGTRCLSLVLIQFFLTAFTSIYMYLFHLYQINAAFSILPLVGYSNTIGDNALEIIQWKNIYDKDPVKREMDQM